MASKPSLRAECRSAACPEHRSPPLLAVAKQAVAGIAAAVVATAGHDVAAMTSDALAPSVSSQPRPS
eukprot:365076-Chlamydomonas_euryale.AAC.8